MNQKRTLVWDYSCHAVYFFDVTPLTDADVLQVVACAERADVIGEALAYGHLHWFEGGETRPVWDILSDLSPYSLEREDVGWVEKVLAAMPEDTERQREYKGRYTKRVEELSRG